MAQNTWRRATTKLNLGDVYKYIGEFEKALNMYTDALPVMQATFGSNDHDLITLLYNIAKVEELWTGQRTEDP